jgi:hypothetical protein
MNFRSGVNIFEGLLQELQYRPIVQKVNYVGRQAPIGEP